MKNTVNEDHYHAIMAWEKYKTNISKNIEITATRGNVDKETLYIMDLLLHKNTKVKKKTIDEYLLEMDV